MNRLVANIKSIETEGKLSIVNMSIEDIPFKTIVIETTETAPYLKAGNPVQILFKETEVVIAKEKDIQISLRNQIPCEIISVEKGKLLSRLHLSFQQHRIISIITSASVEKLNLKAGDKVLAMIKTNEIMLAAC